MNHDTSTQPTLKITELHIYPIKSCAGIALQEAVIETYGLKNDRNWVIVEDAGQLNAKFITQRDLPRMACIQPILTQDKVRLNAPGMPTLEISTTQTDVNQSTHPVTVWRDTIPAWDEGVLAAEWLSDFLRKPVRLMRYAPPHQRICDPTWTGTDSANTRFADGYPILLTNEASLADLNHRLRKKGESPIPMNRFRPNLVVSGMPAFEEDYVTTLGSSELRLRVVKPCTRCSIPSVDQTTGQSTGIEPTATLSTYRLDEKIQGLVFGQNAIVTAGAGSDLRVGQILDVAFNF